MKPVVKKLPNNSLYSLQTLTKIWTQMNTDYQDIKYKELTEKVMTTGRAGGLHKAL